MGADIVVVDDDVMVGDLTTDLLSQAGYTTHLVRDSVMTLSAIREEKPKLVLLDILMPGLDGMTLLHEIKHTPELAGIKIAVVSGKNFKAEIDRALSIGADCFIQKPYDIKTFANKITELIGPPAGPPLPSGAGVKNAVSVRVWGSSTPLSTPCLSVEAMDRLLILDAGEGVGALGEHVLKEGKYKEAWLLLSHFHNDHVCGLGSLPLLRREGFALHILGPSEPGKNLSALVREAMARSFGPNPAPITAKLTLHELREDTYELAPGLRISPFYANHPTTTLGFRLNLGGRRVVYCPDSELYGETATALQDYDEKTGRLCRGSDLLIHDARYSEADHEKHAKEGHSSVTAAAAFAADSEAARLILFHVDPAYSEQQLEALESAAKDVLEPRGARIPCFVAKDGLALEF